MRSVATLIAGLLPPEAAEAIRQITQNEELLTLDERMRPVANPELPEIARALPADTSYQITRTAERLGYHRLLRRPSRGRQRRNPEYCPPERCPA